MGENEKVATRVTVGVDGSATGERALGWAAAEAERRGLPLRVVHALDMPLVMSVYAGPTRFPPTEEISDQGRRVLDRSEAHVHELHPELAVETVLASEDPAKALLSRISPDDLLVTGSRGLGAARSALESSVSVRLAARAICPVIVVPHGEGSVATPPRRIVVGVDGSEDSRNALGFALREAARVTNGSVVVVHSRLVTLPFDPAELPQGGWAPPEDLVDRWSQEMVADMLARIQDEETEGVGVAVSRVDADPATALIEAGESADMIVVGSRGRGSVRGLLLGSVSQGVLRGATVPVVVLPRAAVRRR
ncbi:universal stress protein [Nocardiopsis alba]|uniref:universal stress protein n=1 Tax=Nocardiopsis alba TaxID=53437 RepID=UPI0033A89AE0